MFNIINIDKIFIEKFKNISKKGWIANANFKSWGSMGLTFEKEIGKSADSKYLPDFNNIEIKCCSYFSNYPLYLFTIAFDGPGENEIQRIADKYGYYDKDYNDKKVIFRKITNKINQNNKYNFFFEFDSKKELIYLSIYDNVGALIERESYINISTIKHHLETKLQKMAIISVTKKTINNELYFKYFKMSLYKIKKIDIFFDLIKNGTLEISIISRISKSGKDKGRYRNKNIVFAIPKENINKLFDRYYTYTNDSF